MQLKIKDNREVSKEYFKQIDNVTKKIADKTLEQLEKEGIFVFPEIVKDAEDITRQQIILKSVNDCYLSSNVMGFLGYGNERLVIESRFSSGGQDYFTQYMLERVLGLPNFIELNTDSNRDIKLYNLLVVLFPYFLKTAMRKGVYKRYIKNKYNDLNVKGTINVARHISKNTPFIGNIACDQREFSYDNYLMELVRHTIEFIKRKSYGDKVLGKIKSEVKKVVEETANYKYYDRRKIVIENKNNPIRHAYYREYRALQRLCIMILQNQKHQIGSGIQQTHGILFDGAWLWEEYVNSLISNLFYHPMNKGGKGAQRLFSGNKGLIYPDFISKDKEDRVIADAKYKPVSNIGNKDYLQVLAYMFRFDAQKGLYIYPEQSDSDNIILHMNQGLTYENNVKIRDNILVIKCGLKIPKYSKDYDQFVEQMKQAEKDFRFNILAYS